MAFARMEIARRLQIRYEGSLRCGKKILVRVLFVSWGRFLPPGGYRISAIKTVICKLYSKFQV